MGFEQLAREGGWTRFGFARTPSGIIDVREDARRAARRVGRRQRFTTSPGGLTTTQQQLAVRDAGGSGRARSRRR